MARTIELAGVDTAMEELAAGFRGDVIRPGDSSYVTRARKVWNGLCQC